MRIVTTFHSKFHLLLRLSLGAGSLVYRNLALYQFDQSYTTWHRSVRYVCVFHCLMHYLPFFLKNILHFPFCFCQYNVCVFVCAYFFLISCYPFVLFVGFWTLSLNWFIFIQHVEFLEQGWLCFHHILIFWFPSVKHFCVACLTLSCEFALPPFQTWAYEVYGLCCECL